MTADPRYSQYAAALECVWNHSRQYLEMLHEQPVAPTAEFEQLQRHFKRPLPQEPVDGVRVLDNLIHGAGDGLMTSTSSRFFGWVIGGTTPAALAADWLTSLWDQNAGMYDPAPAACVVEEVCGNWLKELLQLPADASFALVTGCQMAHVTCLNVARHELLRRTGWDVERQGLYGTPPIQIITSQQRHGSIERALRILGMGTNHILDLKPENGDVLSRQQLSIALKETAGQPTIVLLQAGDLHTGAFDHFADLIPLAHEHKAWVHVDGAFGMWAAASEQHRHLVDGIERANSWATDAHKWLNVPHDCGCAFVADADAHRRAFSHDANYIRHDKQARDQIDWNIEYSRRARAFPTYAAIASLGRRGIGDIVSRCCALAAELTDRAGQLDGAEIVRRPIINQSMLRFVSPDTNKITDDDFTDDVTRRIVKSGEAFFANSTWQGMRCMRVSVSNWRTTEDDVERTVRAIEDSLRAARRAIES